MRRKHYQSGVATIIVTLLLMFGTSIIVLYMNRSLIFEQKSSANQLRSTKSFEMAEAGIEWATGMLNKPYDIGTDCIFLTTTNISFRKRYMQPNWNAATNPNTDAAPVTNVYPGCKVSGTTLTCSCPAVPAATTTASASLGPTVYPGFTVAFAAVLSDPSVPGGATDVEAIRVTATGCTDYSSACAPGTATSSTGPDAVATVTAIIKLRPTVRAAPPAALTCGNNCSLSGSFSVTNTDPSTNGILIDAGGTASASSSALTTLPGLPSENAVLVSDSSLSALYTADPTCSNSAMFSAYFGSTISAYVAAPSTKSIPNCSTANTCGGLLGTAYNDGWRSFYFPDGMALNNSAPFSVLGSASDPVTIVVPGAIDINGTMNIYGLVFSNDATLGDLGTGSSTIHGALVACGSFNSNGNGNITYDGKALLNSRRATALAVRVLGSWTDACKLSATNPPVLSCN